MSFSFWHQNHVHKTDFVIVGGGIAGLSVAYWLGKLYPKKQVTLIEGLYLGAGATGRNAGFLLQGTASNYAMEIEKYGYEKAKRLWSFSRENIRLLKQEAKSLIHKTGSYQLAGSAAEAFALERSAQLLTWDGFKAKVLSEKLIQKKIAAKGFFGGLFLPDNGQTHSIALVQFLAEKSKAYIREGRAVASIENNMVVLEDGSRIVGEQLICTLNAYLPILLPEWKEKIHPVRAQMLSATLNEDFPLDAPLYSHEGYFYLRKTGTKRIILGGARHLHRETEVGYEDTVTEALQTDLQRYFRSHFPTVRLQDVDNRWSGTMGFTASGLPILENPHPQQLILGGFNGHGMGYGFHLGKQIAATLNGADAPDLDLFKTI